MSIESNLEIMGGQILGEKAEMLQAHEPAIKEVGLEIPPTIVIASECVQAELSEGLNAVTAENVRKASEKFNDKPFLVVRSSAEGDGIGNGVYDSRFATSNPEIVTREAELVIASFSSPHAKDFRRQARLGEDFALMIQPVIGQRLEASSQYESFGPYLSGFGYTSTPSETGGYMNLVPGLGGGVDTAGGLFLTREKIDKYFDGSIFIKGSSERENLSLSEILEAEHEFLLGEFDFTEHNFRHGDTFSPYEFTLGDPAIAQYLIAKNGDGKKFELMRSGSLHPNINTDDESESDFCKATKNFIPENLMAKMQELEKKLGYPIYYEWALETQKGNMTPVIVQVAPAEKTRRYALEEDVKGSIIAEARIVDGHGTRSISKIVLVTGELDVDTLKDFNDDRENEGYLVIFGSALSSNRSNYKIGFKHISNAGAILEIPDNEKINRHAGGNVTEHLVGASRQTDKIIGEFPISDNFKFPEIWYKILDEGNIWEQASNEFDAWNEEARLRVMEGNFTIYADETTGKIIVAEED